MLGGVGGGISGCWDYGLWVVSEDLCGEVVVGVWGWRGCGGGVGVGGLGVENVGGERCE